MLWMVGMAALHGLTLTTRESVVVVVVVVHD